MWGSIVVEGNIVESKSLCYHLFSKLDDHTAYLRLVSGGH